MSNVFFPKVAYISPSSFSDVDISLIKELQIKCDLYYFILVPPSGRKNAAIDFSGELRKDGLYVGTGFDGFRKYSSLIDLNKVFVVYYNSDKGYSFKRLFTNFKLLKRVTSFDVLHFTWPIGYTFFPFYFFRKKIVLTVHDPLPHSGTTSKIYLFERFLSMKLLSNFILLNRTQKKDFVDYYKISKKQKIFTSSLGCYDYLNIYSRHGLPSEKRILFFGKIYPYKGLDVLLPAMKEVHETNPDAELVVAGNGKFYFDISEYENLPYIKIINRFIPDEELVKLINESFFVVLPYKDATQSGVVMTSFALDKPCVVTDVGGLKEMVVHQKYGMVIPPDNPTELAKTIRFLLDNPEKVKSFSEKIKTERKNGMFSWSIIAEQLMEIYSFIAKHG